MVVKTFRCVGLLLIFLLACFSLSGQNVPDGIAYQAVARDNSGKELINRDIEVKFSILSGSPIGTLVYQEIHSTTTSKFGVFTLKIGMGDYTEGTYQHLVDLQWGQANHYLKVEIKLDNDFIDMGTMQFLTVPYALYSQKSLEPGPAGPPGPKGESGDPASDNQSLSFDMSNLTISNGNSIPLTSLLQNLTITSGPEGNYLGISRGNSVLLSTAEADGDPTNELQDLTINNDKLKITKNPLATEWDLRKYLDNTDAQALTYNAITRKLGISGNVGTVDLTELKDDADASPTNELQDLSFNQSTNTLSISGRNSVVLGSLIAFRAQKTVATSAPMPLSSVDFIVDQVEYNDGTGLNVGTGEFTAPFTGIYTFDVKYTDPNDGGAGRKLMLFKNGNLYEYLESMISVNSTFSRTLTIKLVASDKIKLVVYTGTGTGIGTGTFSGYRVN